MKRQKAPTETASRKTPTDKESVQRQVSRISTVSPRDGSDTPGVRQMDRGLRQAYVAQMGRRQGNRQVQRFLKGISRAPAGILARTDAEDATAEQTPDFDPATTIEGDIAEQLETILQNSAYLRPYIQEKLTDKPITESGKFVVYSSDPDFDAAYIRIHKKMDQLDDVAFQERLKRVQGFYERANDAIHLRPKADKAHALHEAVHRYSERQFRGIFSGFIDEGVTQFFTDRVLEELGQPAGGSHGYQQELALATDLVDFLGEPFTAENFFREFNREAVLDKIGITMEEFNEKYRFTEEDEARFVRYIKKLLRKEEKSREKAAP